MSRLSLERGSFVIACLLAALVVVVCVLRFAESYNVDSARYTSALEYEARKVSKVVNGDIDSIAYQMTFLGKQITSLNYKSTSAVYKLLNHSISQRDINNSITWNSFSWVDDKHLLTVDAEAGILEEPKDLAIRDYIPLTAKEPWVVHLGQPVYGAVSRQFIIPLGMGYTVGERYIGTLAFGLEIAGLLTKLENFLQDRHISFALLDQNGRTIAASRNGRMNVEKFLGEYIGDSVSNGATTYQSFTGEGVYSYNTYLTNYPYRVVALYDPSLVNKGLIRNYIVHGLEALFALTLVFLLWALFRYFVIVPIEGVTRYALRVNLGDDKCSIPEFPSVEWNSMVDQVAIMQERESMLKENKFVLAATKEAVDRASVASAIYFDIANEKAQNLLLHVSLQDMEYTRTRGRFDNTTFEVSNVNISDVARNSVDIFSPEALKKKALITLDISDNTYIRGDKWWLFNIFGSLLYNALCRVSEGGNIKLFISEEEDGVFFGIEDNGDVAVSSDKQKELDFIPHGMTMRDEEIKLLVEQIGLFGFKKRSNAGEGTKIVLVGDKASVREVQEADIENAIFNNQDPYTLN